MKKLCLCLDVDCRSLIKKVNIWTQNSRIKEVIVQRKKDKIGRRILMMFFLLLLNAYTSFFRIKKS